jgi:hypothetical protein
MVETEEFLQAPTMVARVPVLVLTFCCFGYNLEALTSVSYPLQALKRIQYEPERIY